MSSHPSEAQCFLQNCVQSREKYLEIQYEQLILYNLYFLQTNNQHLKHVAIQSQNLIDIWNTDKSFSSEIWNPLVQNNSFDTL